MPAAGAVALGKGVAVAHESQRILATDAVVHALVDPAQIHVRLEIHTPQGVDHVDKAIEIHPQVILDRQAVVVPQGLHGALDAVDAGVGQLVHGAAHRLEIEGHIVVAGRGNEQHRLGLRVDDGQDVHVAAAARRHGAVGVDAAEIGAEAVLPQGRILQGRQDVLLDLGVDDRGLGHDLRLDPGAEVLRHIELLRIALVIRQAVDQVEVGCGDQQRVHLSLVQGAHQLLERAIAAQLDRPPVLPFQILAGLVDGRGIHTGDGAEDILALHRVLDGDLPVGIVCVLLHIDLDLGVLGAHLRDLVHPAVIPVYVKAHGALHQAHEEQQHDGRDAEAGFFVLPLLLPLQQIQQHGDQRQHRRADEHELVRQQVGLDDGPAQKGRQRQAEGEHHIKEYF